MNRNRTWKILLCTCLALILTACSSDVKVNYSIPTEQDYANYLKLSSTTITVGSVIDNLSMYEQLSEKGSCGETLYKQKLGLYDFGITEDGIVTNFRTASKEIKVSGNLYCGQSFADFESYMHGYTKIELKDNHYVFYSAESSTGVEILLDKESFVDTIRVSSMTI